MVEECILGTKDIERQGIVYWAPPVPRTELSYFSPSLSS